MAATGARTGLMVLAALGGLLAPPALAQTPTPAPLDASPRPAAPAETPNAVTPPGGIARGVIQPGTVDPGMVASPPANLTPAMPVIRPPGTAR